MSSIGQRIHQLREQRGLSQGDIAKVTGMLGAYISRVEHGHTVPSLESLERFAAALGIPLYELFFHSSTGPSPVTPGEDKKTERFLLLLQG